MYDHCDSRCVALAFILILGACSPTEPRFTLRPAAQVVVIQGDSQLGIVHQPLANIVGVRVLDDRGQPIPDQPVSWRVVKGGGSTFAGFTLTNDSGIAREQWTLGDTAGTQQLEARAIDSVGTPIVFARLTATAQAGPLAYQGFAISRVLVPTDQPFAPVVIARDAYGNTVVAPKPLGDNGVLLDAAGQWTPSAPMAARFRAGTDVMVAYAYAPQRLRFELISHYPNTRRVRVDSMLLTSVDSVASGAGTMTRIRWTIASNQGDEIRVEMLDTGLATIGVGDIAPYYASIKPTFVLVASTVQEWVYETIGSPADTLKIRRN